MQAALIITEVVSSNAGHGEVYSIQHYIIKFVSDLQKVDGFLGVLRFPPNKTDRQDIIESNVIHHKPNQIVFVIIFSSLESKSYIQALSAAW